MSTRVRQRPRPSARAVQRAAESEQRKRHQVLDLLNAVVLAHGGAIDLTFEQVDDVRSFPVRVDIDHEARVVRLRSEGYGVKPTIRQRIAGRLI